MPLPRKKFREMVFQLLFSKDFSDLKEKSATDVLMRLLKTTKAQVVKAQEEIDQLLEKKSFLDDLIRKVSEEYRLERISKVELNILRLALFELFFIPEISKKITIAEAIRLNRKFGSEKGSTFVQALLNRICLENPDQIKK